MVRYLRRLGSAVFITIALLGAAVLILCMLVTRESPDEDHT